MEDYGELVRNWGYYGPGQTIGDLHVQRGQYMGGFVAGIMTLHSWLPKAPGHIGNASTFPFPVRYLVVEGADQMRVHAGDETLLPALIKTAKQLERDGCRMIASTCGYFGHFQKQVADAVDAPVYLSAVVQIPWIRVALKKNQKIGIICGESAGLDDALFDSCGVSKEDRARCVAVGGETKPVFRSLKYKPGHYNYQALKAEIRELADQLVRENPDLGAILFECTDLPPFAADIQARTNLPVYDSATMIRFLGATLCQKPYYGFI